MKRFRLNRQYLTVALYAIAVVLAAFLFGLFVFNTGEIAAFLGRALDSIKALPYGILLALILYPFVNLATSVYSKLFEKKKPHPRLVSILSLVTVYLGFFLVIAIILLSVIPPMIGTVGELLTLLEKALVSGESTLRELMAESPFLTELADGIVEFIKTTFQNVISADIAGLATSVLTGLVGETFDILVGLIISLYLLAGRRLLGSIFGKIVAALLPAGGAQRTSMFIKRLYSNLTEFIAARILSALFLGAATYLLFWLIGAPFYPLMALVIAALNLFPVFGTILSLLICGTVLLITKPIYALPVLGIIVVLEILDNLLVEPRTITHKPLRPNIGTTIVLMLVGYALLGLGGAVIAIPVFATVRNAIRAFSVHLLNRRHLPTAVEDYRDFNIRDYMTDPAAPAEEGAPTEESAPAESVTAAEDPAEDPAGDGGEAE